MHYKLWWNSGNISAYVYYKNYFILRSKHILVPIHMSIIKFGTAITQHKGPLSHKPLYGLNYFLRKVEIVYLYKVGK